MFIMNPYIFMKALIRSQINYLISNKEIINKNIHSFFDENTDFDRLTGIYIKIWYNTQNEGENMLLYTKSARI